MRGCPLDMVGKFVCCSEVGAPFAWEFASNGRMTVSWVPLVEYKFSRWREFSLDSIGIHHAYGVVARATL